MASEDPATRKTRQWQLECLGHAIIEWLAGLLPGPWLFHIGEGLASIAWHFMPSRRRIVLRNLRIAFADELNLDEIKAMAKASFRRTGANLISAAHTARLPSEKLKQVLHIENLEVIEDSLTQGRGVVLLLSHMGNWELLSRIVHLLPEGTRTGAFYRPLNNALLNDKVLARREADGTRMFSKRDPFHQVCGFLRNGALVGILADQRVGLQGEIVPFFGRTTRSSPLPSLLARRTKSEVVALSLASEQPGKWKATLSRVEPPATTMRCTKALEQAMASSPVDVFWLQERWRCYLRAELGFKEWLGSKTARSLKPHRLLLWIPDAPPGWKLPANWIHPDVNYEVASTENQTPLAESHSTKRSHIVPASTDRKTLQQALDTIDLMESLPIDAVVSVNPPAELRKACKHLAISFYDLTSVQ